MKKFYVIILLLGLIALCLCPFVIAEQATVTTNATSIVSTTQKPKAFSCSVKNTGTSTVYIRENIQTSALVISNAIPLEAGDCYNFITADRSVYRDGKYKNIVVATTNGTSTINVAFE